MPAFLELRAALETGAVRAAEPDPSAPLGWRVNAWVKRGILLGFRLGELQGSPAPVANSAPTNGSVVSVPTTRPDSAQSELRAGSGPESEGADPAFPYVFPYIDKHTYPTRSWRPEDRVRIVPGGSSVRSGAYLAPGVVCMPPMYVNVGACVGAGAMIDSHALVGSCAQIGERVHLSAAAQIGGVVEPVNATPVILEDDVLVGGNCGVYEGTLVRRGAVLAAGTILTRGTPVYDLVRGEVLRASAATPLVIPENAVVVPGSRAVTRGKAAEWGLSLYTPVIVKYRDEKTDLSAALEEALR